MFSSRANYLKLRTNLRLCINRLKLLEKKKTELALKARREISDYIAAGKEDRARIRVEHIIREDYLVEALEIVEMLCDLLLARFGLIEKMNELDPGLEEAISTIIWVTPRLSADVQELREVAHQLTAKYGKEYADMCRRNGFETVNEKVLHKLSLAAPPKILIENYMIEIARTYKVPFEPDPDVMMGQPPETGDLIELGKDALSSFNNSNDKGSGGFNAGFGGGSGGGQCTTSPSPGAGFSKPQDAGWSPAAVGGIGLPSDSVGGMPQGGYPVVNSSSWNCMPNSTASSAIPPVDNATFGIIHPGSGADMNVGSTAGANVAGGGFGIPQCHNPLAGGVPVLPDEAGNFPHAVPPGPDGVNPANTWPSEVPPPLPSQRPNSGQFSSLNPPGPGIYPPSLPDNVPNLPSYDEVIQSTVPGPSTAPVTDFPVLPDVPGLPSVPTGSVGRASLSNDDVDFDDLSRRFEELKKRK